MTQTLRKNLHLVCGGKYHDFDYARLELLKLFAEIEHVRVSVASDYSRQEQMHSADAMITYTSDVIPDESQQDGIQQFLREGGKWFALHGTNSCLRYNLERRHWEAPEVAPRFFNMLGSQFQAHPPIQEFTVRKSKSHPLVNGIRPFKADDEIYLCEFFGEYECLLETQFSGTAPGFQKSNWRKNGRVPIMYLHPWEDNEILYLNLGHARGHYDMEPLMSYYKSTELGSWKSKQFHELIRRGIRWALQEPI
jgi:uncharacterized protein